MVVMDPGELSPDCGGVFEPISHGHHRASTVSKGSQGASGLSEDLYSSQSD